MIFGKRGYGGRALLKLGYLRLLGVVSLLALAAVGCGGGRQDVESGQGGQDMQQGAKRIVILHTNDFHGHLEPWHEWEGPYKGQLRGGLAYLAAVASQARQEAADNGAGVLMLDAGDAIGDTMIQDLTKGDAMIQTMREIGYDGMAMGNHEPDFGPQRMAELEQRSDFPILAANVLNENEEPAFQPYIIKEVNGLKVGILGLGYHNTAETSSQKNVRGLQFTSGIAAARRWVPVIRKEGADVVVVLSHQGLSVDLQTAREVKGIDAIIGGHSHNRTEQPIIENGIPVVQAGAHGSDLGKLELAVENGKVSVVQGMLLPVLASNFVPDVQVESRVAQLEGPHRDQMDQVVGQAEGEIVRAQTINPGQPSPRNQESPADSLFTDILRQRMNTDVAFLPGLGYGIAIPPGSITRAQITQLLPHLETKVWTMRMSGSSIQEVLEQAVTNFSAEKATDRVGGVIQVSGLTFKYDKGAPAGQRVWEVTVNGEPLQPDRQYTVATNSLLAQGGHKYAEFKQAQERAESDLKLTDVVIEHLQQSGPVSTPPPGRIQEASKP